MFRLTEDTHRGHDPAAHAVRAVGPEAAEADAERQAPAMLDMRVGVLQQGPGPLRGRVAAVTREKDDGREGKSGLSGTPV